MKKCTLFFAVVLILAVLFQAGCSKKDQTGTDWEQIIRTDFFSGDSGLEQAMAEAVSVKVRQDGEVLTVTVKAPDICDDLLSWMESVSDAEFTESAMEEEILRLLKKTDKTVGDYVMGCSEEDGTAQIAYTAEFGEAVSCGLTRFYAEVTERILEEMEDEAA